MHGQRLAKHFPCHIRMLEGATHGGFFPSPLRYILLWKPLSVSTSPVSPCHPCVVPVTCISLVTSCKLSLYTLKYHVIHCTHHVSAPISPCQPLYDTVIYVTCHYHPLSLTACSSKKNCFKSSFMFSYNI